MPKILIVEDEDAIATLLRYNLAAAGFEVEVIYDGEDARLALFDSLPDLLILDWMLPHITGYELCRQLRQRQDTAHLPILMLTARGEESDKIRGLEIGADDYMTKPFSVQELIARVKALLRRANPAALQDVLQLGKIKLDRAKHRVFIDNIEIDIPPTEFRVLEIFMQSGGKVLSRERLLLQVWPNEEDIDERTVDVHIGRLRKSLRQYGVDDYIRTVRGAGYAFEEN